MDLNTWISLGILGLGSFLARGVFGLREDVREIKTTLGINGHPAQGIVPEVENLREAKHDHANKLHVLAMDVALLKQRLDS